MPETQIITYPETYELNFLGRNGTFKAKGLSVFDYETADTIVFEPITSKGVIGRCSIEVPKYAPSLRELIATLQKIDDQQIESCAKCGAAVHRINAIDDAGTGPEAGHIFFYCSDRCLETH